MDIPSVPNLENLGCEHVHVEGSSTPSPEDFQVMLEYNGLKYGFVLSSKEVWVIIKNNPTPEEIESVKDFTEEKSVELLDKINGNTEYGKDSLERTDAYDEEFGNEVINYIKDVENIDIQRIVL